MSMACRGEKNPSYGKFGEQSLSWKGGKTKRHGYVFIMKREHPFCNRYGYVQEHRVVYEEYHKCCLLSWVDVHHKDGIKDNNTIENLQILPHGEHSRISRTKHTPDLRCLICNGEAYIRPSGTPDWRFINGLRICPKCYARDKRRRKKISLC